MYRYVSSAPFPRTLALSNRVLTGTVDRVVYLDSDSSSDYSTDSDSSDSDSDDEFVRDYCTKKGSHHVYSAEEWARSGGCKCKGKEKKKKKCGLMEWFGGGKKKKKKKCKCCKGRKKKGTGKEGCGCGGQRRYKEHVVHEIRGPGCGGGCREGVCREEHHHKYSCRVGHGRGRRYDEGSEDEGGRAVYRGQRERRRQRSRGGGGYREGEGMRLHVPVDVDFTEVQRPMNARVVMERNEEGGYGRDTTGQGMGPGAFWEPPILGA